MYGWIEIDLNGTVEVELTEEGIKIAQKHYRVEEVLGLEGNILKTQLHEFIHIFGGYIKFGTPIRFMKGTRIKLYHKIKK